MRDSGNCHAITMSPYAGRPLLLLEIQVTAISKIFTATAHILHAQHQVIHFRSLGEGETRHTQPHHTHPVIDNNSRTGPASPECWKVEGWKFPASFSVRTATGTWWLTYTATAVATAATGFPAPMGLLRPICRVVSEFLSMHLAKFGCHAYAPGFTEGASVVWRYR